MKCKLENVKWRTDAEAVRDTCCYKETNCWMLYHSVTRQQGHTHLILNSKKDFKEF